MTALLCGPLAAELIVSQGCQLRSIAGLLRLRRDHMGLGLLLNSVFLRRMQIAARHAHMRMMTPAAQLQATIKAVLSSSVAGDDGGVEDRRR